MEAASANILPARIIPWPPAPLKMTSQLSTFEGDSLRRALSFLNNFRISIRVFRLLSRMDQAYNKLSLLFLFRKRPILLKINGMVPLPFQHHDAVVYPVQPSV